MSMLLKMVLILILNMIFIRLFLRLDAWDYSTWKDTSQILVWHANGVIAAIIVAIPGGKK